MIKFILLALLVGLSSCATNEHDAQIEIARYTALQNINTELNKSDKFECESGCTIEIANRNKVKFSADMLQEFGAIDRLIAGGVSITEIIARGVFNPATLQAFAMYKGLEVVAENGGTRIVNNDSYNSHSEANQANQSSVETVSGIKAGGNVDQSQQNQNNPTTNNTETNTNISKPVTTDNSTTDSNNGGDDNSTEIQEPAPAVEP